MFIWVMWARQSRAAAANERPGMQQPANQEAGSWDVAVAYCWYEWLIVVAQSNSVTRPLYTVQ